MDELIQSFFNVEIAAAALPIEVFRSQPIHGGVLEVVQVLPMRQGQ